MKKSFPKKALLLLSGCAVAILLGVVAFFLQKKVSPIPALMKDENAALARCESEFNSCAMQLDRIGARNDMAYAAYRLFMKTPGLIQNSPKNPEPDTAFSLKAGERVPLMGIEVKSIQKGSATNLTTAHILFGGGEFDVTENTGTIYTGVFALYILKIDNERLYMTATVTVS